MKRFIIYMCVFLIVGCSGISKQRFVELQNKHDSALSDAQSKLDEAKKNLVTSPPKIAAAIVSIDGAKVDVTTAQDVSEEIVKAAITKIDEADKAKESFWSYKQKVLGATIGVIVALVGLAVVLLRWGKLGGMVASIPILGMVVAKITSMFRKPK
jgi:hypothetical protein